MTLRKFAVPVLALAALLVFAATAHAEAPAGERISLNYFQRFVIDGGFITWGILIPLSVVTLALILDHAWRTRPSQLLDRERFDEIAAALRQGDVKAAWDLTTEDDHFLSAVVRRGLAELPTGPQAAEYAVIEASEEQASRLFSRIEYLNIIGNVSPMIGLIGTVYGIILAFNTLADVVRQGGVTKPDQLAEGISIALVNTFWGLIIAIPALAMYGLFRNRIDVVAAQIAAQTIALLKGLGPTLTQELRDLIPSKEEPE
jgi:biopolymer transport protein ExbB